MYVIQMNDYRTDLQKDGKVPEMLHVKYLALFWKQPVWKQMQENLSKTVNN